jgi:type IV pilus assembly protein PilM
MSRLYLVRYTNATGMSIFGSNTKVGVDIGTSAIKIVELGMEKGRFVLKNYGIYELRGASGAADSPKAIMDLPDAEISAAIAGTLKAAGIGARTAVASVSSFSTFATVVKMPYTSEEDLATAIPLEARKYVPVPLDHVVLDWSLIGVVDDMGTSSLPQEGQKIASDTIVEVFLAAVPKDETARYQRIFSTAGLSLEALELENSSLVRSLLGNDLSPTAILNMGGRSTSILVVDKGYERLSHNYEIGGYEMTKAIVNALGVSFEEAELLKRNHGLTDEPGNQARSAILSIIDMMIFETRKTIEAFEQEHGKAVERVVLVGGLANIADLAPYIKSRVERPVLVGNVFARLQYPPELSPLVQQLSNTLAIAVGCAMRGQ